jgi:hypothetical protein
MAIYGNKALMKRQNHYQYCLGLYQSLKKHNQELIKNGVHDYSLINSLLSVNDEVRLHSRFIFSIINPHGLHYQGALYLKLFMQQLPEEFHNFLNCDKAVVVREQNNIDLLIHDYEHFLIIENKLNAADQKHQITRYIQSVQKEYLNDVYDLSNRVKVIYLSKTKVKPSAESDSMIGFNLTEEGIVWKGIDGRPDSLQDIHLEIGVRIPFQHYSYFPMLEQWIAVSIKRTEIPELIFAFKEYSLILEKLNPNKKWRKVLMLDDYALKELGDEQQREMYQFMVESRNVLPRFVANKLFQELIELFGEDAVNTPGSFGVLNPASIEKWLKKSGKREGWKDIGFEIKDQMPDVGRQVGFVLATDYAYLGEIGNGSSIYVSENKLINRNIRNLLLNDSDGLYQFFDIVKRLKTKLRLN